MRLDGKVPEGKVLAANQLAQDMGTHRVIAVADLAKVRSSQVLEMRRKLRGRVKMLVTKNALLRKAAESLEEKKKNIAAFTNSLSGPNLLLLTDIDPFELTILLGKSKVRVAAKAGETATGEIVVPAGNTGLPPGPIISEFNEAKIPTKIESGSIWVVRDTVVAKRGDVISAKVASVLSKLGIKPIEAGISLKAAYEEGLIFGRDDLLLDLKEYRDDLTLAVKQALGLAIEANYLTAETAPIVLSRAHRQAMCLAARSEYPADIVMPEILREAFLEMKALSESLVSVNKEAAPASYEAPAPARVIPPKVEAPTPEPKRLEEVKPMEPKVVPMPVTPQKKPPLEKAVITEVVAEKPAAVPAEKPAQPKIPAAKKVTAEVEEPKPKKRVPKEKVEKKEKAKKGKTKSR